jgi:hypothetical protein
MNGANNSGWLGAFAVGFFLAGVLYIAAGAVVVLVRRQLLRRRARVQ